MTDEILRVLAQTVLAVQRTHRHLGNITTLGIYRLVDVTLGAVDKKVAEGILLEGTNESG